MLYKTQTTLKKTMNRKAVIKALYNKHCTIYKQHKK